MFGDNGNQAAMSKYGEEKAIIEKYIYLLFCVERRAAELISEKK